MLLVIAHPDDESMFMVPSVSALKASGYKCSILCLSEGIRAPKGGCRVDELHKASRSLGISPSDVHVGRFDDGMDKIWEAERVAATVADTVTITNASFIITFDAWGVTGHPNHVAAHRGVKAYASTAGAIPCFALESVNAARKFVGSVADILISGALHVWRTLFTASPQRDSRYVMVVHSKPWVSHDAMRAHGSQYVWFRALFLLFSRYTWVNTLEKM